MDACAVWETVFTSTFYVTDAEISYLVIVWENMMYGFGDALGWEVFAEDGEVES